MSLAAFRNWRTQFYPPKPTFTEEHVGPQNGRVFIVTGGNAGVGFELVKILYATGATIYMASRSKVSGRVSTPPRMLKVELFSTLVRRSAVTPARSMRPHISV